MNRSIKHNTGIMQNGPNGHVRSELAKVHAAITRGNMTYDDTSVCSLVLDYFSQLADDTKKEAISACTVAFYSGRIAKPGDHSTAIGDMIIRRHVLPDHIDTLDAAVSQLDPASIGTLARVLDYDSTTMDAVLHHPLFTRLKDAGIHEQYCRGMDNILVIKAYEEGKVEDAFAILDKAPHDSCRSTAIGRLTGRLKDDSENLSSLIDRALQWNPKIVADVYVMAGNQKLRAVIPLQKITEACAARGDCPSIEWAARMDEPKKPPLTQMPQAELVEFIKAQDYPPRLVGHLAIRLLAQDQQASGRPQGATGKTARIAR